MKLVSWNVNGIRSVLKKGFLGFVEEYDPDVLCLQEVRATQDQVDLQLPGYATYWNAALRKGYSGTAVFSRLEPSRVRYGMGVPKHDSEGRLITLEFPDFHLVNVYTPNSGTRLQRLAYRTQEWNPDFLAYLKRLESDRPVVFCGDMNVAHKEVDLFNPKGNQQTAGFTAEEREGFDRLVDSGFLDTFREFCTEGDHYTWWSYMGRARERNHGWRIDYFCISPALRSRLVGSAILSDVRGSDHCPVEMALGK